MSAGGAFGGARGYQPRPPEKGVFPLDHFGECKKVENSSHVRTVSLLLVSPSFTGCRTEHNSSFVMQLKEAYMDCLKTNSQKASVCQELSKQYLQCRMER